MGKKWEQQNFNIKNRAFAAENKKEVVPMILFLNAILYVIENRYNW